MPNQHKRNPRPVRLGELDARVVAYAEKHDRTVNSVIVEAVSVFLGGATTTVPRGATTKPVVGYSKGRQTGRER